MSPDSMSPRAGIQRGAHAQSRPRALHVITTDPRIRGPWIHVFAFLHGADDRLGSLKPEVNRDPRKERDKQSPCRTGFHLNFYRDS